MQKDGHKIDFDTVAETLRAMQHVGLIENRPYKGEESFYVIDGATATWPVAAIGAGRARPPPQ